jgi:hypothetical protein
MDFAGIFEGINLTSPSWDLFVLITFLFGIYFYLFRYGKDRAFIVLLASYVSLALVERLPLIKSATGLALEESYRNKAILFIIGILAISWMMLHSDFTANFRQGSRKAWFETLVLSFLQIGFIISVIVSFMPVMAADSLSIFLRAAFVQDGAQLFWLIAPFFAILLIKEK